VEHPAMVEYVQTVGMITMGMTNKQFGTLIAILTAIVLYSGIVFLVADNYGKITAVISLNILNVCFFLYILFVSGRIQNDW
jgi:hypothetical protein